MSNDIRKKALWDAMQDAAGAVAAFKAKFGHEPSEAERTIALSLFIDAQKALQPKKQWGGNRGGNGGQQSAPVAGRPDACIECQGTQFYDNRQQKASGQYGPTSPDFKCKTCKHAYWVNPPKRAAAPVAEPGANDDPDSDASPW